MSNTTTAQAVPDYGASPYPVRADLADSHRAVFQALARAGTWLDGQQRLAIAAEARAARDCKLCAERKAALSPFSVDGPHDGTGVLDPTIVDVIHRIITDPGRLSRSWFGSVLDTGALDDNRYVELISVAVVLNAMDLFAIALGIEPTELPAPEPGEPTRARPASAQVEGAWVAQIPADGGDDWQGLYGDREFVPQIGRALSLVPDEVRLLMATAGPHYMTLDNTIDPTYTTPGRAIDRLQMELVAARVSSINDCFY